MRPVLAEALAPDEFRKRGQARFDCDVCGLADLSKRPLADYAAVCLLDPTPLEPAVWQNLADYAAEGHGVAIFLGRNASPIDSFNDPRPRSCCRASCCGRPGGPTAICTWPRATSSTRSWPPSAAGAASSPGTPSRVSLLGAGPPHTGRGRGAALQRRPAGLLERPVGKGRVADDDHAGLRPADRKPWNLLPVGEIAWPFVILVNQMAPTWSAAATATELSAPGRRPSAARCRRASRGYLLFTPAGRSFRVLGRTEPPRVGRSPRPTKWATTD